MIIVTGSSNPNLAHQLAKLLASKEAQVEISKFPNGEKRVWINSDVKNHTVVVIQSFSEPVDEHIMEMCLLVDALTHMGASKIIGLVPWLGYSPQDKSFRPGEPVSIQAVARILEAVGLDELITVDIHSLESLGFFTIPTKHESALKLFESYLKQTDLANSTVVALDKGSLHRAEQLSSLLDLPLCVFSKQRDRASGQIQMSHVSGQVAGLKGISFDDFVSTGSTQIEAASQLKDLGLTHYTACVTHAVFAGSDTSSKLAVSQIDQIITTNSYYIPKPKRFDKLKILSIAPLLAESLSVDV